MNKLFLLFIMLMTMNFSFAASADDYMRSGLKSPVVVAVLLCIFIGIALFLVLLEKRIRKIES